MEIRGVGTYAPAVNPSVKSQVPAEAESAVKDGAASPAQDGTARAARPRVRAKDLLTEDEQRYLENLFPGATGATGAQETYAGTGRTGSVVTGSIVDRKG